MPRKPAKRTFASIDQMPTKSKRWRVRYTGPDGSRHKAPHTFATRVDAEAFVAAKRREIDRGLWNTADDDAPQETFREYAERWLPNREVRGRPIKARTREQYRAILDNHLLPAFGDHQLAAIKPAEVREWYAETLVHAPTMRAHTYDLLRTIMGSAVNEDLIDANPCRIPGAGSARRVHKIRPASIEELTVMTNEMPEDLRLMVMLGSWCAIRFGEAVTLRRADIDLRDEVIHVRTAAERIKGSYEPGSTKTEASVRDVSIPPHIIPAIEQHLDRYVGTAKNSRVFPTKNGGLLRSSTFYRHWYRARAAAGRDDLRFHDLRHSGAVLAAATGATLAELMERLGHSTPQAAMRYQHAVQGRSREIAALLSKLAANAEAP